MRRAQHIPKSGGSAVEASLTSDHHLRALQERTLETGVARMGLWRRLLKCGGSDTREWGGGVHLPESEALRSARLCARIQGPILTFAVVRDVDEVARSAFAWLAKHHQPNVTCDRFREGRYNKDGAGQHMHLVHGVVRQPERHVFTCIRPRLTRTP